MEESDGDSAPTPAVVSVALKEIKEAQILFLNYAYYTGTLPAYVDKTTGLAHHVKSKLKLTVYYFLQIILFLQEAIVIGFFCHDILNGKIDISVGYDVMHMEYIGTYIFTGFLHLHTVWKSREIVPLINNVNICFARFEATYGTGSAPKIKNLYGKIMKAFFWLCTFVQALCVIMYLRSCELHYYNRILHICDPKINSRGRVKWSHASIPKVLFFCVLQLMSIIGQITSIYVYIAFALPAILQALEMQLALKHTESGSYFNVHLNWVQHYKSVQILVAQVNDCVQAVLMPVHISCILTIVVVLNTIIIRIDLVPTIFAAMIVVESVFLIYLEILFGLGGRISAVSEEALIAKKKLPEQSKADRFELKSLRKVLIGIGETSYLDEQARLIAYMAIVDYTVNMLLTLG